jgi:hypothetical protein
VQRVVRTGVQLAGNRTFYYRGPTIGWVEAKVSAQMKPAAVIERWSKPFYDLLRHTTHAENARLAQAGPLLLEIQGRVVRIEDPK